MCIIYIIYMYYILYICIIYIIYILYICITKIQLVYYSEVHVTNLWLNKLHNKTLQKSG